MKVVYFYCRKPKKRRKVSKKTIVIIVVALVVAGALVFHFVPMEASAAQPKWYHDAGKNVGEKIAEPFRQGQIYDDGMLTEEFVKNYRIPAYEHVRDLLIDAKETGRLTETQLNVLARHLDEMMGERTAKTYNDIWHRLFAKTKGGLQSGKLTTNDFKLLAEYLTDPDAFPWQKWSGTSFYSKPNTPLWKRIGAGIFGEWVKWLSPGAEQLPPSFLPSATDTGMIHGPMLPGTESTPVVECPRPGWATLHQMPGAGETVLFDDMSVPAEFAWMVWVGPIIIAIRMLMGIPF